MDIRWPKDVISAEASLKYWTDEAKRNNTPGAQKYYSDEMIVTMIRNCNKVLEGSK